MNVKIKYLTESYLSFKIFKKQVIEMFQKQNKKQIFSQIKNIF